MYWNMQVLDMKSFVLSKFMKNSLILCVIENYIEKIKKKFKVYKYIVLDFICVLVLVYQILLFL